MGREGVHFMLQSAREHTFGEESFDRPDERREQPRVSMEVDVLVSASSESKNGEREIEATTMNLSEEGIFVQTEEMWEPGTEVTLSFQLPDGDDVSLVANIRWRREEEDDEERAAGWGAQFEDVDDDVARAIARFVEARLP